MAHIDMRLLCTDLEAVAASLATDPEDASAWSAAREALATFKVGADDDAELVAAIDGQDADVLTTIVEGWTSGNRLLLVRDRDVLKRAMKAYRKSLKVTVLDAESSLSGGHLSSGRESSIVGIIPPERYPRATWDQLVRDGRLEATGRGTYALGPKA